MYLLHSRAAFSLISIQLKMIEIILGVILIVLIFIAIILASGLRELMYRAYSIHDELKSIHEKLKKGP